VLRRIPVPEVSSSRTEAVVNAVTDYFKFFGLDRPLNLSERDTSVARELLLRVDNALLRMYALPRGLEYELLDYFDGWPRDGVPFMFDRYFPVHFSDPITLMDYLAITVDWSITNRRRDALIRKKIARTVSEEEQVELIHLQSLASSRVRLLAPLPLNQLEQLHRQVVGEHTE
jgi:hypothetical protein